MITITHQGNVLAMIIPADYHAEGIHFFTPDDFSQQMAYMHHSTGHLIAPHFHNKISRKVFYTQETLFIRKGKLEVDFYDDMQNYLKSYVLNAGDVILLASGGHGFTVLEELEMIEIKQGPYTGRQDKTRFISTKETNDSSQ